jgi:hypothetical protein
MGITVERTIIVDCDSSLLESLFVSLFVPFLLLLEESMTQVPALRLYPSKQVRQVFGEYMQDEQAVGHCNEQLILVLPLGFLCPNGQPAQVYS